MENRSIKNIEQLLLKGNERNHESSECPVCVPDIEATGGRWIKKSEIKDLDKIGQPVYMDGENILLYPLSHDLIIGSTGSGKTTVLYNNWINFYMQLPKSKRPSFLVFDLKGDMYTKHGKRLEELGYKLKVFNARDAFFSAKYNPLTTVYDYYAESRKIMSELMNDSIDKEFGKNTYDSKEEARAVAKARAFELKDSVERYIAEISEIFVNTEDPKNKNWYEGAQNCLRAILFTMLKNSEDPTSEITRDNFNIRTLCDISFHNDNNYENIIKWLKGAREIPVVSGALGSCYELKAQVTRDGYISSLNAELNRFSSTAVGALTARAEIDFSEIANSDEDYAIFLIPDDRRQVTNKIAMMMLNDLIITLCEKADKLPAHTLEKDFIVFADEMGNLPKLPGMSNKISTLRSRKIWLQMAVQSLEQLNEVYNNNVAATILDNCDLHLFLGCNNDESKIHFCKSMGERIGIRMSASISATGIANISETTENVPVVRKSDLDALKLGEFYIRSRQCKNLKSFIRPYFMRDDVPADEYKLPIRVDELVTAHVPYDISKHFPSLLTRPSPNPFGF